MRRICIFLSDIDIYKYLYIIEYDKKSNITIKRYNDDKKKLCYGFSISFSLNVIKKKAVAYYILHQYDINLDTNGADINQIKEMKITPFNIFLWDENDNLFYNKIDREENEKKNIQVNGEYLCD